MADDIITMEGATELNEVLASIQTTNPKIGNKVTRSTLGAGATETAKRIRRRATSRKLKKAIGSKVSKKRGQWSAKAGGNVGRKRGTMPQFHLLTIGTTTRRTSSGANRGRVRPNDFVYRATISKKPIVDKMRARANARLEAEVRKAAKQT